MSEAEQPRTKEIINQEYNEYCLQAGDLAYRIKCMQDDLALMQDHLRVLNQEAAALSGAQDV